MLHTTNWATLKMNKRASRHPKSDLKERTEMFLKGERTRGERKRRRRKTEHDKHNIFFVAFDVKECGDK